MLRYGTRVVVEVIWYYAVRDIAICCPSRSHETLQTEVSPVSVPMIGAVKDGRIVIPLSQPITQQMFTCFNPWHPDSVEPFHVEVWSTHTKAWCPATSPSPCIFLPLDHIELPVLRFPWACLPHGPQRERVIIRPHPADKVARGRMQLTPMCSMKAQMYDLGYIWPEHFTYPRARYDMVWKVDASEHESSGNAIKPYKEYEEEVVYMEGRENAEVLGISRVVWSILVDSDSE